MHPVRCLLARDMGDADLQDNIRACRICADRFAATATRHGPNPVVWFRRGTPIMIAGQAPGLQVHKHGKPFVDRSGDRLRAWMGLDRETFYDRNLVSVLPAAFCFPGYDASGADLPPPSVCAATWFASAVEEMSGIRLRVLVGGYAHRLHMGKQGGVTETVRAWRSHAPHTFVLPHPSWRNNAWLRRNPWFEAELVPELRKAVRATLGGTDPSQEDRGVS